MAGARAQDTSWAKPILQLSRHGMLLRSIRGLSRLLANRWMEESVCLRGAEGIASKIAEQVGVSTTWAKRAADCLSKGGFIRRRDRNCSEKNRLTRWRTDPRKASAKKAGDRVGARSGIRSLDCVVGS